MVFYLVALLHMSFLNVFLFITTRMAGMALTSLLLSLGFGPLFIRWLRKVNVKQVIRQDGPKTHQYKKQTPTMGGVFIVVTIVVGFLFWANLSNTYSWIMIFALVGFGAIGFLDDWLKIKRQNSQGLSSGKKFGLQVFLSLIILIWIYWLNTPLKTELFIPTIQYPVWDMGWFYFIFGVFVLLSCTNAVNLTDGLDGLAAGLLLIVFSSLAVVAYVSSRVDYSAYLHIPFISGSGEIAIMATALIGALIGFLWYNTYPAQVMMGDVGSLSLGGILALMAILLKKEVSLVVFGGVFVIETLSVIIQVLYYKKTKRRFFNMAPLHHHFELSGIPEMKVVVRFWIVGFILSILGLILLRF